MYRKKSRGWYKHKDFILIDLACLFMALILAYLIRNGSVRNLFTLGIYRNVMIFSCTYVFLTSPSFLFKKAYLQNRFPINMPSFFIILFL